MEHFNREIESLLKKWRSEIKLIEAKKLNGGISANCYLVKIDDQIEEKEVVLRIFGTRALGLRPLATKIEFTCLKMLENSLVPAPKALALVTHEGSQAIVMEYRTGHLNTRPKQIDDFLDSYALELWKIHQTPISREFDELIKLENSNSDDIHQIKDASDFEKFSSLETRLYMCLRSIEKPSSTKTLLHADYWPGNVLCTDDKVTTVLDWEECCIGDPYKDLAIAHIDLAFWLDIESADKFVESYFKESKQKLDSKRMAWWKLFSCLRPAGGRLPQWAKVYPKIGRSEVTLEYMTKCQSEIGLSALKSLNH